MFRELGVRPAALLDRHDRVYRRWAARRMRSGEFWAYLVEAPDGTPLGSGSVWLQPQQPRPFFLAYRELPYVLSMYTEPSARGRGVATRILEEMIEWARRAGYPRIFLHASKFGRPVYARAGFQPGNEMRLDFDRLRRRAR